MSTLDDVLNAVHDLHNSDQIITRESLSKLTGHKLSIIDDRLQTLLDNNKISRVQKGIYVPIHQHPQARQVCVYRLPDGTVKLEIGDDHIITMVPSEARMVGMALKAEADQYAQIEIGHHIAIMSSEFHSSMRRLVKVAERLESNDQ